MKNLPDIVGPYLILCKEADNAYLRMSCFSVLMLFYHDFYCLNPPQINDNLMNFIFFS